MELCDVYGWTGADGDVVVAVVYAMVGLMIAASVLGDGGGDACNGAKEGSKFLNGGESVDGMLPPGAVLLHEDAVSEVLGKTCTGAHEKTSGLVQTQIQQAYHCWDLHRTPMDLDLTVDFVEQIRRAEVVRLESET